jgi:peptide/nickel transport system substrate-binding protein
VERQTERLVERYFFGRLERLVRVRRFIATWLVFLLLLISSVVVQNNALSGYYQSQQPVPGGIFREGIVGTFGNANPIYATSDVDASVSRLIFAGLFKYDDHNRLVGDLAQSWSVDQTQQVYTVKLRPNLHWQDGAPLTAHDVAFTYTVIQNPDAESPLRASWTGITVQAKDNETVVFYLPNPLSSFVGNLTNGIVPRHLLNDIPMTGLRSAFFNTQSPIGAGPFKWHDIRISGSSPANIQEKIALLPFDGYWDGAPKLKTFTLHVFAQESDMIDAYRDNQLSAMSGLSSLPADIAHDSATHVQNFTLTAANMVFFRTTSAVLSDKAVRQALVFAANPEDILSQLDYPAPRVDEPFLGNQFAYDARYAQQTDDVARANKLLDAAGWKLGTDDIRIKGKRPLVFTITAAKTPENSMVVGQLQRQWAKIGVSLRTDLADEESFHATLLSHEYDAIVYGVTIGADPDVFVYWDSSQNDIRSENRLNLSEYDSDIADTALEGGRTRTGDLLRKIKYQPFLQAWRDDAPALGLYQPRFMYVTHGTIYGLEPHQLNSVVDRYGNVGNWMIRTVKTTNDN